MNTPVHNLRPRRHSGIPDVIFILLVANGLMFALQQFEGFQRLVHSLALWPIGSPYGDFMPWQLVNYGFLHGDTMHILFNMFMLWMFGRELEHLMGSRRFLTYFLTGVIGAGLIQLIVAGFHGGGYPTVGASGGVFALLLAFGMTYPNRMVMLIFPPIPMTLPGRKWQRTGGRQLRAPRRNALRLFAVALLGEIEAAWLTS